MKRLVQSVLGAVFVASYAIAADVTFIPTVANIQGGTPTSVLVCQDTCSKSSTAKDFNVKFDPMPTGQFQVTGLVPGKYEAGVPGVGFKFYTVGRNGVLNGVLNMAPQNATRAKASNEVAPVPSDKQYAWCSSTACYKSVWQCGAEPGVKFCNLISI